MTVCPQGGALAREDSLLFSLDDDDLLLAPRLAWFNMDKGPEEVVERDSRRRLRVIGATDLPGL